MLNHVSIIGRLATDAWGWHREGEDFTRFILATPDSSIDPIEAPQQDAVRVSVIAYGALARLLRGMRAGYQIAVIGQLGNIPNDIDLGDSPRLQVVARDVRYLRFQLAQKPLGYLRPQPRRYPPPSQEPAQGAGIG